jgi:hypothetical protein
MDSLEGLNAQQRAVLELLLRQGKSYDEIGALLHSDAAAIRRRAQGAVGALAPADADVSEDRRNEIADYLLGQQTASQRAATREYLEGSAAGRGWARAASSALAPVGGADKLPDVPAEPEEVAEAFGALQARISRQEEVQRSAKRGNALMSAGLGLLLAIVIIVAVALISSGGDDNSGTDNAAATTTTPRATATSTAAADPSTSAEGTPQIVAEGNLRPPAGGDASRSGQVAIVLFSKSKRIRLALTAKGLPATTSGSAYAVWFFRSKNDTQFLGFPDKIVGADGRLDAVADIPADARTPRDILLTTEHTNRPKTPGDVVLRSTLRYRTKQQPAGSGQTTTTP